MRYKNTLPINEGAAIDIRVTDGSSPVPADITVRLDGTTVATHNGPDYRYSFLPFHAGTYPFEVIASRGTQEKHYFGSIVVVDEEVSHAILGADRIHRVALAEIDQALEIPSSNTVGFMSEIAIDTISGFLTKLLKPLINFAGGFVNDFTRDRLGSNSAVLCHFFEEEFSDVLEAGVSKRVELGFDSLNDYMVDWTKDRFSRWWNVGPFIDHIGSVHDGFDRFIVENPAMFSDKRNVDRVFATYSAPIGNVVEKHPLVEVKGVPLIGDIQVTMKGEADLYRSMSNLVNIFSYIHIVTV